MQFTQSTIIAAAGLLVTGTFASPIEKRVQCTNGAVVFAVRGSDPNWSSLDTNPNYAQLPSGMTNVANAIISKAGSGYLQAVAYPAINPPTNNYQDYEPSVQDGVKALTNDILSYINACPQGKVFVMGYSQGAQVVDSALGGTSQNSPIDAHSRITGVSVFADPMFVPQIEPIDAGSAATSTVGGTVTGQQNTYNFLNKYFSTRLRSYCQAGDAFCNSGNGQGGSGSQSAINIHIDSPEYFQNDATAWMTSKI